MNNLTLRLALLCAAFVATTTATQAQMKGWEVGGWLGTSYYLGDLNTSFYLGDPNLAGGIGARYNFNDRIAVRFGLNAGQIEADDANSDNPFERARNLNFESVIYDGTLQLEFNFLPYIHGSREQFFSPYVFGGISAFYFNPTTEFDNEQVELRPLGTEGQFRGQEYYTVTGAFTYGVGFKIDLNFEWSLDIHAGFRNTFSDYLDDVSTVYPDISDLRRTRGERAVLLSDRSILPAGAEPRDREGEQRGDSTDKDKYFFFGIGLNYYFGDIRCPSPAR